MSVTGKLASFLYRNNVEPVAPLPLVHTTRALHLKRIRESNSLVASDCNVFKGEKLNYFFVGRPSYKYSSISPEAKYWELPCCFIFEFEALGNFKRIFPFDSGAFHKQILPEYFRDMRLNDFEATSVADATQKIMGSFFGSAPSYFRLKAKDVGEFEKESSLTVFDEEIRALHALASTAGQGVLDDRRFCIEAQLDHDIQLNSPQPLAVIAPQVYYDDQKFLDHVQNNWMAQPIGYPLYSLSTANYFAAIYERVEEFYKIKGLL